MSDPSFTKRQKERQRKEKQAEKAAKKAQRKRDKLLPSDPNDASRTSEAGLGELAAGAPPTPDDLPT